MLANFTSPRVIAELNVEHYSALLKTPLDEATRRRVETLLAEERAKLAKLREIERGAPDDVG